MPKQRAPRELTRKDWKNIHAATKRVLYSGEILKHERPDIEQELAVTLWKKSRKFRSRQSSWDSFSYLVIENSLKKIIRDRLLPSARYRNNPSLSLNLQGECTEEPDSDYELIEQINTEGLFEDGSDKPEHTGLSLKIDMDKFVAGLPDDLRIICNLLKKMCICDVAKKLGISRTTLYGKIKAIKKGMNACGLTVYF